MSGLGGEEAWDVAIQSDGKIVLAGYTGAADASDFAVARLNPNGSPDPSFGGDGFVTTDFGPDSDIAFAVEIQQDGRIVVAGLTGPPHDFALARYNHDGTLDSSFDGDGRRTIDFGGGDVGVDLAIQSDGKLVVAGASSAGASEDFALARLNPDGSLDTQGLDPRMMRHSASTARSRRTSPAERRRTPSRSSRAARSSSPGIRALRLRRTIGASLSPATTSTAASIRASAWTGR